MAVNLAILQHSHKQLISLAAATAPNEREHIDLINYTHTHTVASHATALRRNAALLPPAYDFGIGIGGSSADGGSGGGGGGATLVVAFPRDTCTFSARLMDN